MKGFAAFLIFGWLAAAGAQAEETLPLHARNHGVFLNLGVFSAVGFGGATYAYAPAPNLILETGVGLGISGAQLSFMPKLALGQSHRFIVGAGPSVGYIRESTNSLWANLDLGYEYRSPGGVSVGVFIGWTKGLAGCAKDACRPGGAAWGDESDRQAVFSERAADVEGPQGRATIGYWF